MKVKLLSFHIGACLLLAISSCTKDLKEKMPLPPVDGSDKAAANVSAAASLQLIWSDEFNGNSIDGSKWQFETGPGVNNEKQYYQASNASVSNGNLVITARNQSVNGWPYTSARMNTAGRFTTQYGRIEARIKLPSGQGLWPAFWMLGSNIGSVGWPKCGEIDIMEHVNTSGTIYGTIHWDVNGHAQYGKTINTNPTDYHLYAVEWDAGEIRWFLDNNLYCKANILNNINSTEEFHKPFFIILNLAVAGDFPGQIVDLSKLPAKMYVDYVKVYALK
jgi:beta-glucanase (GH16 family)